MTLLLALSLGILAALPGVATANADGLTCLKRAQGDTLFWNSKWQRDNRDENVEYQILHVSERYEKGRPAITLELSAISSASRPFRYVSVADPRVANGLCSRLSSRRKKNAGRIKVKRRGRPSGLSLSGIGDAPPPPPPSNAEKKREKLQVAKVKKASTRPPYPFISYSAKGWVRSEVRKNATFWDTCSAVGRRFTCLKSEKKQYRRELNALTAEARAIKGL